MASEKDFTISYSADSIDTTAKGDAAATNMAPEFYSITIDVGCLYVSSDAAQARLETLVESNTQVVLNIERSDVLDKTATAVITSLVKSHSVGEAATFEASFDVDGAMT
jgi:predicted secreted protein